MALEHHPKIRTRGLYLYYDPANIRSYVGSGVTINNLKAGFGCTLVNGPTFSSSNQGYFLFDGSNDYAQLTLPALTDWSFSFWIYNHTIPNATEKQLLSTNGDPTGLSMVFTYYNIWNGTSNLSTSSVGQSVWTNVVFTNIGFSSSAIYVDGRLDAPFNTGNQIYSGAAQLLAINGTSRNTQAYLGTFMGYNRSLTAAEVLQNYNSTKRRYGK